MKHFAYLNTFFGPFKRPRLLWYIGPIAKGVPYFFPRRWVRSKDKHGYRSAKYIKYFGFDYCSLGWKMKYDSIRFEWPPMYSFVLFGLQIHLTIVAEHPDQYWEAWIYYELYTDKTKSVKERIEECKEKHPKTITHYEKDKEPQTVDYYRLILKPEYQ